MVTRLTRQEVSGKILQHFHNDRTVEVPYLPEIPRGTTGEVLRLDDDRNIPDMYEMEAILETWFTLIGEMKTGNTWFTGMKGVFLGWKETRFYWELNAWMSSRGFLTAYEILWAVWQEAFHGKRPRYHLVGRRPWVPFDPRPPGTRTNPLYTLHDFPDSTDFERSLEKIAAPLRIAFRNGNRQACHLLIYYGPEVNWEEICDPERDQSAPELWPGEVVDPIKARARGFFAMAPWSYPQGPANQGKPWGTHEQERLHGLRRGEFDGHLYSEPEVLDETRTLIFLEKYIRKYTMNVVALTLGYCEKYHLEDQTKRMAHSVIFQGGQPEEFEIAGELFPPAGVPLEHRRINRAPAREQRGGERPERRLEMGEESPGAKRFRSA